MKTTIKNGKGQNVVVLVDEVPSPIGLAFVMHGLGGSKEELHIQTIAQAFVEAHYTTVRFDTTNSVGESDGKYEDATVTNYYADLEDVIDWTKTQTFYQEPFVLAGHSLGGLSVALYTQRHPTQVKALAPISTVVSGALSLQSPAYRDPKELEEWKRTGFLETESASKPGMIKRLKWSHMEDRLKYDLLPEASKLVMPVLMVVGDNDDSTPPDHQKLLYDQLPGRKEFHIIQNCSHVFRTPEQLAELKNFFVKWIGSI